MYPLAQTAVWCGRKPVGSLSVALYLFGSYALDLQQAPEEALRGQVITLSGPMQASGNLELEGRQYDVEILLSSERALNAQLQEMLSLIAVPEDDGYRISVAGGF